MSDENKYPHLFKWTPPDNYCGASWPDYYYAPCTQHRDSDCLTRSNFKCLKMELDGLPEFIPLLNGNTKMDKETMHIKDCDNSEEIESRIIVRENHWAVGWVEWIAIHEDDIAALELCEQTAKALDDYPVLDESDYSDTEANEANEIWQNCYDKKDRIEYIRRYRSQFEFHDFNDLLECVRGEIFAGCASELLNG